MGLPLPEELKKACFVEDVAGLDENPLACAYARPVAPTGCVPLGTGSLCPDPCDALTASLIAREVSDGVIAPGYSEEALEILKTKRKGSYNVVAIDPNYVPAQQEEKQVYGVTFSRGGTTSKLTESS